MAMSPMAMAPTMMGRKLQQAMVSDFTSSRSGALRKPADALRVMGHAVAGMNGILCAGRDGNGDDPDGDGDVPNGNGTHDDGPQAAAGHGKHIHCLDELEH